MQVPRSVAIMQVLRFYCNYVGGTFSYSYVDGSFCCDYTVRSFCAIYADESFCSKYVGENFYWNYAGEGLCYHYTGGTFYNASYTTISIVIMLVAVSAVAMYVTVSSSNFIFLSQLTPTFHKIDKKTFKGIISCLHFTTFVNILPKLRYFVGRNYIQIS